MKPRLIKFKDGTFGVRRLTITGYEFLNLAEKDYAFWYVWDCVSTPECRGTYAEAMEAYNILIDKGTPTKITDQGGTK